MKKLILFILTVAVLILVSNNYEQNYYIIPEESIRIRIIPNSNNIKDQYMICIVIFIGINRSWEKIWNRGMENEAYICMGTVVLYIFRSFSHA